MGFLINFFYTRIMRRYLLLMIFIVLTGCGYSPFERRSFTIGRDTTWHPLQLDSKAVSLTAFTTALTQEIARLEQLSLDPINIDAVQLLQNLEANQVDAIFSSLTPSLLNEKKYYFSNPIVLLGSVLIVPISVPPSCKIDSLEQLEGKIVGVYQYDQSILLAQKFPRVVIQLYQSMPAVLEDLQNGTVDAVLMPNLQARSLVFNRFSDRLKIITEPLTPEAIRLMTLKNQNSNLIRKFNKGLKKTIDNGTYGHLRWQFSLD